MWSHCCLWARCYWASTRSPNAGERENCIGEIILKLHPVYKTLLLDGDSIGYLEQKDTGDSILLL